MPILLKRFHHRGAVPRWAHDGAKLWNGAEMRERNGKRGKMREHSRPMYGPPTISPWILAWEAGSIFFRQPCAVVLLTPNASQKVLNRALVCYDDFLTRVLKPGC